MKSDSLGNLSGFALHEAAEPSIPMCISRARRDAEAAAKLRVVWPVRRQQNLRKSNLVWALGLSRSGGLTSVSH